MSQLRCATLLPFHSRSLLTDDRDDDDDGCTGASGRISGGSGPDSDAAWPPVNDETAARLVEEFIAAGSGPSAGRWNWLSPGSFAQYHSATHGITMVNGAVTLQAALLALGVRPGDEVIVPGLTWLATGMATFYIGATPVFVDIEPDTLCMDPAAFEAAITPRTRAVIPVHLYGSMADLDRIIPIARQHNIKIVEDCAHMQGGVWAGRGAGSLGDIGSFSFQQSKTVTSGECGICITSDEALAERLYRAKHIGYTYAEKAGKATRGPAGRGWSVTISEATEFHAVVLDGQMAGLSSLIQTYNRNAARLEKRVREVAASGLRVQARGRRADPQGYYSFVLIADRGPLAEVSTNILIKALAAEGVPFLGTYGPVYRHALWNLPPSAFRIAAGSCPVAEGIGTQRAICLQHPWLDGSG